jgi:hypothetical protein
VNCTRESTRSTQSVLRVSANLLAGAVLFAADFLLGGS